MGVTNNTVVQEMHQKLRHLAKFGRDELSWSEDVSIHRQAILVCLVKENGAKMTIKVDHKHKNGTRVSVVKFFETRLLIGKRFDGLEKELSDWIAERNKQGWKASRHGGNKHEHGAKNQSVG